jgi:RNA polymerase sigma-70 factor (ECF subfamily)
MPNASDRLLVQKLRKNDQEAWRQLLERYYNRLYYYVRFKLGDNEAEDVVQETLLGFLRSLSNFDEDRDLLSYLYSIAKNKITDRLRKNGRDPKESSSVGSDSDGTNLVIPDNRPGVSTMARSRERRNLEEKALVTALSELIGEWKRKGDYKRLMVLELLFVKRWPNNEIAAFLGIPDQHVANIRFAAIRKLAAGVKNCGLPEEAFLSSSRRSS